MNWWLRYLPFAIALAGFGGVLIYGLWDAASNIDQLRHILVLRLAISVSITVISLTFALPHHPFKKIPTRRQILGVCSGRNYHRILASDVSPLKNQMSNATQIQIRVALR